MYAVLLRRSLYIIPILILISMISFAVTQVQIGNSLTVQIEELREEFGSAADRQIKDLRDCYGLDQPIYQRYLEWLG